MAERAALAGAFVDSEAPEMHQAADTGAALLPTGHSLLIRQVNRLIGQVAENPAATHHWRNSAIT